MGGFSHTANSKSINMNELELIENSITSTSFADVPTNLPFIAVPRLLTKLIEINNLSPHVEFILKWINRVVVKYAPQFQLLSRSKNFPHILSLQKELIKFQSEFYSIC